MFKYTKHSLKKIENLFEEIEYQIRYEKGSFQSGYCMVEHRKIAVINKFFDTEARINALIEILSKVDVDTTTLNDKTKKLYQMVSKLGTEEEARTEKLEEVPVEKEEE